MSATAVLDRLGVAADNPAAASGDGHWHAGSGRFASLNPSTGETLATLGRATAADVEAVVAASASAFGRWRDRPAPRRGLFVRAVADALRANKDNLGALIALETGKIKAEGDGEIQEMIDIADFAVGLSRQLYGLTMASERAHHRMFEQWHPLGPIAVITAFNFPAAVWAWNAFIAAVCGDTVIWKPSPKAPLTAIALQRLVDPIAATHAASGVFTLLNSDDAAIGGTLATDKRLPLVSFTGSSAVGSEVAALVAARFGRCLLECSGNNAAIVDESADVELAVRALLFGAVGTAGQRCTSTRRLFVHRTLYDSVVDRLRDAYRQVNVGDPLDPQTLMGPLIDAAAVTSFRQAVNEALAMGGSVLAGGESLPGPGFFVAPTLIAADAEWPVVHRETFAPILYVMRYENFDAVLAAHNGVRQGLASALFSVNLRRVETFLAASGSDCGIANINLGTSGAEIGGAFGGEKETGGGREAGSDAWKAYMRRQTCTINRGGDLPLAQGIRFDLPRPG